MVDKETQALKRLLKRLSAMRQTLRADERMLLDRLIVGAQAEVKGHAATPKADPKPSMRIAKNAEVKAHSMTSSLTPKVTSKITSRVADDAEVKGHALTSQITPKMTPKIAGRIDLMGRISIDETKKIYKLDE